MSDPAGPGDPPPAEGSDDLTGYRRRSPGNAPPPRWEPPAGAYSSAAPPPPPAPRWGPPPGYGPPPAQYGPPGYGPPPPPPGYGPPPGQYAPPDYGPPPPPPYAPPGYGPPPPPPYGPPGYGPAPGWGDNRAPGGWAQNGPGIPAWAWPPPLPKGGNEKTGPLPLHPMGVGDILDGAIKLLRANFRTMVIIVATFMIPVQFALAFFQRNVNGGNGFLQTLRDPTVASSDTSTSSTLILALVAYISIWIVIPLVCAGASRVVMASYLGGELKAKDALVAALKHAPALLVASFIVHLMELISLVGLIVAVAFVMPLFIMTAPAISLEDLGPFAGIRRSVSMVRRRYWPTVGIALLFGLLATILNQILGLIPSLIALVIGLKWGWLIIAVSGVLQSFVTVSLITIGATLVYLDARIRLEGFDIEVLATDRGR